MCRWQAQVSVYCAWRIPAHLRCTQCSILLHHMDICFLTWICLWQISQIQTCLFKVVGLGLVSTSPAFVSSSASHSAGPHGWHAKNSISYQLLPSLPSYYMLKVTNLKTQLKSMNIIKNTHTYTHYY